ncbi:fumarylacetoacetate hydrolase family protein [Rhizorhabdus argentea]|uniref:fumarylacetoacetate hydrolase family protein n=1 Tax=Rhizorhabdus argentea TaxID=1387174 RepID=UPI0030EE49F0
MRFFRYQTGNGAALALDLGTRAVSLASLDAGLPSDLTEIIKGGAQMLARIAALAESGGGHSVDRGSATLLNPFPAPAKILCIGLNYQAHADETKLAVTSFPTVFTRFTSTLLDPNAGIPRSHVSEAYDYEVELVAVIGKRAHYVELSDALDHVAGYTVANDVSVRDYQFLTSQFIIGKNFDGTCPVGPDYVTADELPAGGKGLAITTVLNGETVQSQSTSDMIYDVATLVHKLSQVMTLEPGDIILTGTPSGIGHAREPKLYMKDGDVVICTVDKVGSLRNTVHDEQRA